MEEPSIEQQILAEAYGIKFAQRMIKDYLDTCGGEVCTTETNEEMAAILAQAAANHVCLQPHIDEHDDLRRAAYDSAYVVLITFLDFKRPKLG